MKTITLVIMFCCVVSVRAEETWEDRRAKILKEINQVKVPFIDIAKGLRYLVREEPPKRPRPDDMVVWIGNFDTDLTVTSCMLLYKDSSELGVKAFTILEVGKNWIHVKEDGNAPVWIKKPKELMVEEVLDDLRAGKNSFTGTDALDTDTTSKERK